MPAFAPATQSSGPRFSQAQLMEMSKVADVSTSGGIGFGFDSDYVQPSQFENWYSRLNSDEKGWLKSPSTHVSLLGRASHAGSKQYNLNLSERRCRAVAEHLRKIDGFKARIEIKPEGESMAPGQDDNKDNHRDRYVLITIRPGFGPAPAAGDIDSAYWDIMHNRFSPPTNQAGWQQMGILFDVCVKPMKKVYDTVTKTPGKIKSVTDLIPKYDPISMGKDLAKKELQWMGMQLVADIKDAQIMTRLIGSVPWGVVNGLELLAGMDKTDFDRNPIKFSPTYYMAGVSMADSIWAALDKDEKENVRLVMKDPRLKAQLARRVAEGLIHDYARRSAVHTNRSFKTGLDTAEKFLQQHGL